MSTLEYKTRRAEVKVANFIAHHNLPIALADHVGPLFKDIFPDSEIAKNYASARTKTTSIINGALKPFYLSATVDLLKTTPFSLHTDGSNDTGLKKLNPITVRLFDIKEQCVVHNFLDMGVTTGVHAATAESIFSSIDATMKRYSIPWTNCIALGLDNASVNMGKRNSVMSRAKQLNPAIYVDGCPCHMLHNTCNAAAKEFRKATGFDLDEFAVDMFHWFDKSTKRKAGLEDYCHFCDQEYRTILEHVSTRWLSLEMCNKRILDLYPSLRSYFLSEGGQGQARLTRLRTRFQTSMTEVYLLFFNYVFPMFSSLNVLLQREEPVIFYLHNEMNRFLKTLLAKFAEVTEIAKVGNDFDVFNPKDKNIQLTDDEMIVGATTRALLEKLLNDGDISDGEKKKFLDGVRAFYVEAFQYARNRLPLKDAVIRNAVWIDFNRRLQGKFHQVEYFIARFSDILDIDKETDLHEEFLDYQTLQNEEIPRHVLEEVNPSGHQRMDVLWGYLGTMVVPSTGKLRFGMLFKVARLLLTLPHSNAAAERVFSMIRHNKTDFRDLEVDGTLSSILTIKMASPESRSPCYKFNPPKTLVEASKTCTTLYNVQHGNKC